jgi:S1-C subfamily serine protease/dienelactone hydrolase
MSQLFTLVLAASFSLAALAPAADPDALQSQAVKAAVQKVAPCVVQIQTSGGLDIIGGSEMIGSGLRIGEGPTTGVILSPDGYIVSSAYNFVSKPTEIFVAVPGKRERYVAKNVATDTTRMLTLLKIEAEGLPVPASVPKKEFKVGQWALAVGRTWSTADNPPSVSVGILSALDRIWGKAIQTDAKVSPVNYGGPMVDIQGRVLGILVPADPRAQDETAGHEWYDSGIGFAIPLEDVLAVLPRLKEGKNLHRGFLGFTPKSGDIYGAEPAIGAVNPGSTAAKAGLKAGDVIVEIDGAKVNRQAQIMHVLGTKYEGDTIAVKVKRGSEELSFANLKLSGLLTAISHAFLGILPMRDDPELGVEVRYVFPKSPADGAGIKPGDRIMAVAAGTEKAHPFAGNTGLEAILNGTAPGMEIKVDVRRKGADKNETLTVKLAALTDDVPDRLPEPASLKKALEPKKKVPAEVAEAKKATPDEPPAEKKAPPRRPAKKEAPKEEPKKEEPKKEVKDDDEEKKVETGFQKRSNASHDHEYWLYVPENYDRNVAHAVVVWLHPAGQGKDKYAEAMVEGWEDFCNDKHIILIGPKAVNETGWLVSEVDFIREAVERVATEYTVDRQRIIVHGMGLGGQLALYMGMHDRDLFRGVAVTGASLTQPAKPNALNQRMAFFIVAGGKDPRIRAILDTKEKLIEQKFPVAFREIPDMGHQYLDDETLQELVRWIDSLDRL